MFTGTFHRKTLRWISHLTTPDFRPEQYDHQVAPMGFGFSQTAGWSGEGTRIVNIEYSYDPLHEDLQNAPVAHAWGWDLDRWHYHGNAVIGQMIATDNEYGVTGAVPRCRSTCGFSISQNKLLQCCSCDCGFSGFLGGWRCGS